MTYDRYYNLISKVARVKRFIKRHWLVFSIAVLALVFVSLNFVYSFGSFTEGVFCEDSVYGEQLHFGAKTFLSSVSFEFSSDGETWSDLSFLRVFCRETGGFCLCLSQETSCCVCPSR